MGAGQVLPAKNEANSIALALSSLAEQDYKCRRVIVFDDGSTDQTSQVVQRYVELTGRDITLIRREKSIGKTPSLRAFCEQADADAVLILDADTVLVSKNYISALVEELFKNAGVAAVCGEVMPLTDRRRNEIADKDLSVCQIQSEFDLTTPRKCGLWSRILTTLTILYRTPMYLLLQRTLYDGTLKLFGGQLNPVGCAVAYKTKRLQECFAYAQPRVGDNLSMSEDIYIGHFFNWKGYRSMQLTSVRCESTEPPVSRLPRQLFLWSSAFLQSTYYFLDLPLSPLRFLKRLIVKGTSSQQETNKGYRKIKEQYRAAWGDQITRKFGRPVGWLELVALLEKLSYPLILLYFLVCNREVFLFTVGFEALLCMLLILLTADQGVRLKYAAMIVPATPIRLMSLGVDMFAAARCAADLVLGNREWRK